MINRIWTFAIAPSDDGRDTFLKRVEWLNLTDVVLFVNGLNDNCKFSIDSSRARRIERTAERLRGIGVDTHLISWIRPIKTYLTDMANGLRPLCQSIKARSLLFDAEERWTQNKAGKTSCGNSGETWARSVVFEHWPFANWPCPLGVTGIVSVPNSVRPLIELCEYTLPQAYSIASKGQNLYFGKDGIERKVWRPGVTQEDAHKRWREFRDIWPPHLRKRMVMGLAAWKLNRPGGISVASAMQTAVVTSEELADPQITEIAYWSMEWITKSTEVAAFIREAGMKAKQGKSQASKAELEIAGGVVGRQPARRHYAIAGRW